MSLGHHLFAFWAALTLAALTACGSGAGSGFPCTSTDECEIGETCVLRSCDAPEATCEFECTEDADCAGGLDSAPSGAVCITADTTACPVDGQPTILSYCGR